MSKARICGILAIWSSASTLFAGQERGNGGDVVICRDSQGSITSMEMADLFEARTIRHIPLDLGSSTLTPEQKAHLAIERMTAFDPNRAAYFHAAINTFMQKVWFVDFELPDLNDTGEITIPPGCLIHQIAIHKEPETPNDLEFWIRKAFWESPQFDNNQKAALILHEVVFGKLIEQGHLNSRKARALVSYLASPSLTSMTYEQFEKLMLIQLGAAAHLYYFKDEHMQQDKVETIFYLPTRKMDYFDTRSYCSSIAPGSDMYTERDFDDGYKPGVPYRQAVSLLVDIKRDSERGWYYQAPNGCYSGKMTALRVDTVLGPDTDCDDYSTQNSAICECIALVGDTATCKPY